MKTKFKSKNPDEHTRLEENQWAKILEQGIERHSTFFIFLENFSEKLKEKIR